MITFLIFLAPLRKTVCMDDVSVTVSKSTLPPSAVFAEISTIAPASAPDPMLS